MNTWAVLWAGIGLGAGLTLALAWLFSLTRRVKDLEIQMRNLTSYRPPARPTSQEMIIQ